jgi:hypothetical protein
MMPAWRWEIGFGLVLSGALFLWWLMHGYLLWGLPCTVLLFAGILPGLPTSDGSKGRVAGR